MSATPFPSILGNLPYVGGSVTRQIGREPDWRKGRRLQMGAESRRPLPRSQRGSPRWGRGWKVHPFISVLPGETASLADIAGPGCINEFFITSSLAQYSNT